MTARWAMAAASQNTVARVSFLRPVPGLGNIARQREQSLSALDADGLLRQRFDSFRYTSPWELRQRPPFSRLLLLTPEGSEGGADFTHKARAMGERGGLIPRALPVQGPEAAGRLSAAIRELTPEDADVVCLVRGGGSWADLRTFDDLDLARAIAECAIPVMTAIGHKRNVGLADLVAAAAFPTPTDAGALLDAAFRRSGTGDYGQAAAQATERSAGRGEGRWRATGPDSAFSSMKRELSDARRRLREVQAEHQETAQSLSRRFTHLWQATSGPLWDDARARVRRRARWFAIGFWLAAALIATAAVQLSGGWPPRFDTLQLIRLGLVLALVLAGVLMWRRPSRVDRRPSERALRRALPPRDEMEWCTRVARARRVRELRVLAYYRPAT